MIRIELSSEQERELREAFKATADRRLRDRIQIVLMAHRGRPRVQITQDLGVDRRTVQRWLNAYLRQGGLDGLRPLKAPGAPPLIPPRLAAVVRGWVIRGPAKAAGLDRAGWTHEELAAHLGRACGIRVRRSAVGAFCRRHGIRPYRPTYRFLRGDPGKRAEALVELAELRRAADAGELVLLAQDEARFPMVPTLAATLGVKGHRPQVGTRDCKDLLYVFGSVNCVDGTLRTRTLASPKDARRRTGKSKNRRLQEAFVKHLEDVAKAYPPDAAAATPRRVVVLVDNAPWHGGRPVRDVLATYPHVTLKRLPSYSPHLNVIERLWKALRRRATHNRLFETLKGLKASVRNSLRYFQTVTSAVLSLIDRCYQNRTQSAGV